MNKYKVLSIEPDPEGWDERTVAYLGPDRIKVFREYNKNGKWYVWQDCGIVLDLHTDEAKNLKDALNEWID